MFAWATFPVIAAAVRFAIPEPFEQLRSPWTVSPVKVPKDVTLGWAACETTSAMFACATFPVMEAAVKLAMPEPFEALRSP
jgi:hypothetical protein